jgi:hypothetical protein
MQSGLNLSEHMIEFADTTLLVSIKYMKGMQYSDYLKTQHWQHFRSEAIKFFRNICQTCGKHDCQIDIHHRSYDNIGCETFNDVIALCNDCHKKFHNKQKNEYRK